jgi:hypothetical protein
MNQLPERIEAHCPRCNAPFVLSAGARAKRIQCPKCRQTISLGRTEPGSETLPTAEEFAALKARIAEQDALIARLLTPNSLQPEKTVNLQVFEAPSPDPAPLAAPACSLLRPGQNLRWLRRDPLAGADDPEPESILLHNLRALGGREILLQAGGEDPSSYVIAERLFTVFREAGWRVSTVEPITQPRPISGLVLSAGQCPLPEAATAAYMALQAAGYPITSRLDGSLGPTQSVLIAGRMNSAEN